MRRFQRIKNQAGQSKIEYAMITACLALMLIPAVNSMSVRIEGELGGVFGPQAPGPIFENNDSCGGTEGSTHEHPGPRPDSDGLSDD